MYLNVREVCEDEDSPDFSSQQQENGPIETPEEVQEEFQEKFIRTVRNT